MPDTPPPPRLNGKSRPDARFAEGYSRFHTPHRFTLNGTYRLPFFSERNDAAGRILGGWRISAVLKLASGTPFTVTDTSMVVPGAACALGQRSIAFVLRLRARPRS